MVMQMMDDNFGYSVSIAQNYALIGAHGGDDKGTYSGAAYIFEMKNNEWIETAKLVASDGNAKLVAGDGNAYDLFGRSVSSVSIAQNYALIGAFRDDDKGTDSGAAYIFEMKNNEWVETAKLVAGDGNAGDRFGYSVSIAQNYALIGAYGDDDKG
eukprot:406466_1